MKQEMIGDVPGNVLGMVADLAHKLQHGKITPAELGRFLKRENPFQVTEASVRELITEWQNFYREVFGFEKDFTNIWIPPRRALDSYRLIVVAEGMTPNHLYDKCAGLFPSWRYIENLDVVISDRKADHDYAIWVRDRVEADEELKNRSANTLKRDGVVTITLEERLLYELKFFKEKNKHLDISNWTLCAGSRDPHGRVPHVNGYGAYMHVLWCPPDSQHARIRARAAVS